MTKNWGFRNSIALTSLFAPVFSRPLKKDKEIESFLIKCKETSSAEADMAKAEKLGIDTGIKVIHPLTNKRIPVWIGNFVLRDYGTGVVMGVPGHDQRDFEFASKYDLDIKQVI